MPIASIAPIPLGKLTDFARHRLVNTPLEPLLMRLRRARKWLHVAQFPELATVLVSEPAAIDQLIASSVQDGMNCVDVGAHIGSVTATFRRLSPSGKHMAVEPTPYKAAWLKRRFPAVDVAACAVGADAGKARFFHEPSASGFSGLRPALTNRQQSPVVLEVDVCKLDDIVPAERVVHVLKVDVEGGELDVFRGATRILERDRPTIFFECTIEGLAQFERLPRDVFTLLAGYGYDSYTPVDRVHRAAPLDVAAFERAMHYPFRAFNFIALPQPQPAHVETRRDPQLDVVEPELAAAGE